jgi:hypothetical protein
VVASCVAFLDLCGEHTERLRVDVQAARYILSTSPNQPVREIFLKFTNNNSQLLKALKMLEESAWAQEPPSETTAMTTESPGSSPWHLVALFCRVHSLPRSLTLLHELARNGDWVMFLHESDLQQCPADAVRDVVGLYFTTGPLQSHLNILVGRGASRGDDNPRRKTKFADGLPLVIEGKDSLSWRDRVGGRSSGNFVLRERERAIFGHPHDPQILVEKKLKQFRFNEVEMIVRGVDVVDIPSVDCPLLKLEYARIFDREGVTPFLTPTIDDTVNKGQDDTVVEIVVSRNLQELMKTSTVPVIHTVDELEQVLDFFDTITGNHEKTIELVDVELRELLGDLLRQKVESNVHITLLVYYAYCSAYVQEAKFDEFLRSIDPSPELEQHIPELVQRKDKTVDTVEKCDTLLLLVHRRTTHDTASYEELVIGLGAAISVSESFASCGMFQRYMSTNSFCKELTTRICNLR